MHYNYNDESNYQRLRIRRTELEILDFERRVSRQYHPRNTQYYPYTTPLSNVTPPNGHFSSQFYPSNRRKSHITRSKPSTFTQSFVLVYGGYHLNSLAKKISARISTNNRDILVINKADLARPVEPGKVIETLKKEQIIDSLRGNVQQILISLNLSPDIDWNEFRERVGLMIDSVFLQFHKSQITLLGEPIVPANSTKNKLEIFNAILKSFVNDRISYLDCKKQFMGFNGQLDPDLFYLSNVSDTNGIPNQKGLKIIADSIAVHMFSGLNLRLNRIQDQYLHHISFCLNSFS